MKVLLIIRGAPGAGKTTIAKKLVESALFNCYWEADHFFQKGAEYAFDPAKIPDAHAHCKRGVEDYMIAEKSIIVSNTFTQHWQLEPYYTLAAKYGYQVQVMVLEAPVFQNIHGVPKEKVDAMQARLWEDLCATHYGMYD